MRRIPISIRLMLAGKDERAACEEELAYSTALTSLSLARQIREVWGTVQLEYFDPLEFQKWLKALECKPKT